MVVFDELLNLWKFHVFDEQGQRHFESLCLENSRSTAAHIQRDLGTLVDCVINTVRHHLQKVGCKAVSQPVVLFWTELNSESVWTGPKLINATPLMTGRYDRWVIFRDETILQIVENCPQFVRIVDGHPKTAEHLNKTTKHPVSWCGPAFLILVPVRPMLRKDQWILLYILLWENHRK